QAPVTHVSWFAAQAYCEYEGGRLPTWYEWEYVAAADEARADARKDSKWLAKILSWYARPGNAVMPSVGGFPNFYGIRNM
ncbi:SUMF1/EgtB/PvdO family nonheme iron enzyme, partial [Acinetobacter baumannii]